MSLEINPKHPIYQQGLQTLIAHMWNPAEFVEDDVCVVAMLVSMLVNGRYDPSPIAEMIQGRPGAYQRTSQRGSGVPAEKETAEKRS